MSLIVELEGKEYETKEVVLKPKEIEVDKDGKDTIYLDAEGKRVIKHKVQGAEYKWTYEDGTEYTGKSYKSYKGKPISPFRKTPKISNPEKLMPLDAFKRCVINEHTYYLVGSEFKEKMREIEDVLVFKPYKIAGLKAYRALVYYDKEFDRVIMRLCRSELNSSEMPELEDIKEAKVEDNVTQMSEDEIVC